MYKWACLLTLIIVVGVELTIQYRVNTKQVQHEDWCVLNGMRFFNRHYEPDMCLTNDGRLIDMPHEILRNPAKVIDNPGKQGPALTPKHSGH